MNLNDNQLRSTIPDSLSHLEALEYVLSSHGCIQVLVAASTDTAPLTGAGPILLQVSRPGVEPRHLRHTPYRTDSADKSSVSSSMASPLISALRVDVLLRVRVTVHFPLTCQRPLGTACESCRSLFVSGRGAHLTGTVPSSLLSLPSPLTYVLPAHALAAVGLLYSTSITFGFF